MSLLRSVIATPPVVLSNVGTAEDVPVLAQALGEEGPLPSTGSGQAVREHAAWAPARLGKRAAPGLTPTRTADPD